MSCPLHGAGVITNGGVGTINGRQIAHHGSGTSCGATLVVSDDGPTV
ncbi:PAAR repeat-containing protein [Burkholderia multivorans CGD1]|nr:PAAR repeat-containing protein [Burkholderia multivorans CGD1]